MKTQKREGYLSWDEYFMSIAFLSSLRSKDPNTQVGACIVNQKNKIVGIGYNGFPTGCSEVNAILNSISGMLNGCSMYVRLFPCNECAKIIIQSGIKKIIYLSDKYAETDQVKAAKKMFDLSGITYRKINIQRKIIIKM